ncbi:Ribonuclease HI [Anaplasma phagocytophilum]|uniref:Ribonuclease H n=1 Tax=Anaplasma phagocytophilum TaxID=948 RepID=A0AA45USM5_ANAPH|nr:ribonuclease H [Anaplasma phagocytophilum str. MRK]KDB57630.1 ribonuclease H [Anaplasma phagocytophilum str. CRT35]KJZ99939.1 RNase H family protein [Anaplasma phagocytophilum]SBO14228.1 Ribonuclease HI [Anaplasma phagocytophilum]SBO31231.1 Ribonuclease HI [Anaplasma phagocytophilum]
MVLMDSGQVVIYTDGACSGNPGPGGWGAVFLFSGGEERRISGGCSDTTNNRMELSAVIEALGALDRQCNVCVRTDSVYVKNGITTWIHKWKSNGWQTASKSAVKNVDLWMQLEALTLKHNVTWEWVKAHAGNRYNVEADALARAEVERQVMKR